MASIFKYGLISVGQNVQYGRRDGIVGWDAAYKAVGNGNLRGRASSALYADLAERYEADKQYEAGTVLVIGGDKEVTTTTKFGDTSVAGIVSKNPAFMMNDTEENMDNPLWPFIALAGRVPCKVVGKVKKGDRMQTSDVAGAAMSVEYTVHLPVSGSVIGIALEDYDGDMDTIGVIEVMVKSS